MIDSSSILETPRDVLIPNYHLCDRLRDRPHPRHQHQLQGPLSLLWVGLSGRSPDLDETGTCKGGGSGE